MNAIISHAIAIKVFYARITELANAVNASVMPVGQGRPAIADLQTILVSHQVPRTGCYVPGTVTAFAVNASVMKKVTQGIPVNIAISAQHAQVDVKS